VSKNVLQDQGVLPRLIVRPLQEFLQTETAGGLLLLIAAAAALVWANLPAGTTYPDFWGTHLRLDLHVVDLNESLQQWVNDGLMAIFFYVVGLEIKREALVGELADRRKAALPVAAAFGGMLVPALIYLAMNAGGAGEHGWGVPMATDIAFAVGIVALAGSRVPTSLKVFLLALAIVDDIGAIVVIAIFYSGGISLGWLAAAAGLFVLVVALGRAGVRPVVVYLAVGIVAWLAVFESGIHATIAGVVLGVLTPMRPSAERVDFADGAEHLVDQYAEGRRQGGRDGDELASAALSDLEEMARDNQPVLDRVEHALHPWTSYLIIPIFALANAGIPVDAAALRDAVHSPIAVGVALGLVVGKPLGVLAFAWLATRTGLAMLPEDIGWSQLSAVAIIAGVGFTVSLFISALAFPEAQFVDDAKLGILGGSVLMGVAGYAALRFVTRRGDPQMDTDGHR
jgi:NhaA family Na+:H+ antiporter